MSTIKIGRKLFTSLEDLANSMGELPVDARHPYLLVSKE